MKTNELICRRCGKCCYLRHKGKEKKCPYLIILPSRKTLCRIYKTRLGTYIGSIDGKKFNCIERVKFKQNFEDCTYNLPMEELIKK